MRRSRSPLVLVAALVLAGGYLTTAGATGATAATFNVTSGADAGPGSLRQAFADATASDADAVITVAPGLAITLTSGELAFAPATGVAALTVHGNGATVTQAGAGRLIRSFSTGALDIDHLGLGGGNVVPPELGGAAILSRGDLTLTAVTVSDTSMDASGTSSGIFGTALLSNGSIAIRDSSIEHTTSQSDDSGVIVRGGAVGTFGAAVTLDHSSIADTRIALVTPFSGPRVFGGVVAGGSVELVSSEITDTDIVASGAAPEPGGPPHTVGGGTIDGGVLFGDSVVMSDSVIRHSRMQANGGDLDLGSNQKASIWGGAVNARRVSLARSTIDDTSASVNGASGVLQGGGIFMASGSLTVDSSTISHTEGSAVGNDVTAAGGAIWAATDQAVVRNSTIAGNILDGEGARGAGLAFVDASATLVYSTVADNRAPVGSNIDLSAATSLTTVASVIQAVDASSPNCALDGTSSVVTQGYNFADDTSCALTDPTDRQGTANDPELGPLADNGGPTETLRPAPTSPLVDAIPTGSCQIGDAVGITTDQRGDTRPGAPDTNCDIGAVELFTDVPIAPPPVPARLQPRFTG